MKTAKELKPNFGPVYCAAVYPRLAAIFHRHGYALAVHGSLARDLDLIAVPWAEVVSTPTEVIRVVLKEQALLKMGKIGRKNHGRRAYTLLCGWGDCQIDLSFFPGTVRSKS